MVILSYIDKHFTSVHKFLFHIVASKRLAFVWVVSGDLSNRSSRERNLQFLYDLFSNLLICPRVWIFRYASEASTFHTKIKISLYYFPLLKKNGRF
jgi:hypothetical protein